MTRLLASIALLAWTAAPASAEIRLERSGPNVRVRVGARLDGAWRPAGRLDGALLNPDGALRGDGAPTLRADDGGVLAVWVASDASLNVSEDVPEGRGSWRRLARIVDADPAVAPHAVRVRDAWLVAWTSATDGSVRMALVESTSGNVVLSPPLLAGRLQSLTSAGSGVTATAIDAAGVLVGLTLPVPDDLPDIFRRVQVVRLATSVTAVPSSARGSIPSRTIVLPDEQVILFRSAGGTTLHDPSWQGVGRRSRGTGTTLALAGSLVATLQIDAEKTVAFWWRDAHELQYVVIAEDGPGAVGTMASRDEFSPSLVREALRAVDGD